jgi:NAD(P)-dependent dehydrogenase (short-subunit alcohol dehydrogenase family)
MSFKTILITGANGGIGFATTKLFLQKGYSVFAHYFRSNDRLKTLNSKNLEIFRSDLSQPGNAKKIFSRCLEKYKKLDVLFNNAGTLSVSKNIESIEQKDFDYVLNVNLKASFILSQLALKHMKKNKRGRIINISSIGVKYGGNPVSAHYTISKAAVEAMTKLFAKAGAPDNVLVNAVRVGLTDTDFLNLNPTKDILKRIDLIPLKRLADPNEIAASVYFLASEESSYISGSILTVAGGE